MAKQVRNWRWLAIVVAAVAAYALGWGLSSSAAQTTKVPHVSKRLIPAGSVGSVVGPGWTVYMDGGDPRDGARNLNQLHKVMAEKGWILIDMDPRYENNDFRGFFVTYRAGG